MTTLRPRRGSHEVPNYSLTGDLLAFHRCGLQYRYQNRGRLPPSTPVQLWFGGFIHGVMEESYLLWSNVQDGVYQSFPWSYTRCLEVQIQVDKTRLRPMNLIAPSNQFSKDPGDRKIANIRAYEAVNVWGPHLFPLIHKPEVPLHGLRPMPPTPEPSRSSLYEISGVVDILLSANLETAGSDNPLVSKVQPIIGGNEDEFEVVVDYKGSDRPEGATTSDADLLRVWKWQLETYAWLRSRQEGARPVRAGVLLFLNEMHPGREVCERLAERAALGTNVDGATPDDLHRLRNYKGGPVPQLSSAFRLHRSLYLHPMTAEEVSAGASRFDATVALIEGAVRREGTGIPLTKSWVEGWRKMPTPDGSARGAPDIKTCIACDHRTYCELAIGTHGASRVGRVPLAHEE